MTSLVSREDLESEIWKIAGRAAPYTVERLLCLMDRYAIENARKWVESYPEEPEPEDDGWPGLGPGNSDMAYEVTRCAGCGKVKRWSQFYRDKTRSTGRRNRCMTCCKTGKGAEEYPSVTFTCHACGMTKKAGDFDRNAATRTGFDNRCKACKDVAQQGRVFKCRLCLRERPQGMFPPGKLKEPRSNWACLECWPEGTKLPPKNERMGYKCRECGLRKPVTEFPPGKRDRPGSVHFCTDCDTKYVHERDIRTRKTA